MICWWWFTVVERTKNHLKQTKGTGYKKQRFHSIQEKTRFHSMIWPIYIHVLGTKPGLVLNIVCDEWPQYKHLNSVEVTKKNMEQKGINLQKLRGWGWRTQRLRLKNQRLRLKNPKDPCMIYLYIPWMWPPPRMPVTTRIITFLVGDPDLNLHHPQRCEQCLIAMPPLACGQGYFEHITSLPNMKEHSIW